MRSLSYRETKLVFKGIALWFIITPHNSKYLFMANRVVKSEKAYMQSVSIMPDAMHFFYRPVNGFDYSNRHIANRVNLKDNDTGGQMSIKAQKRIKTAVMMLLYKSKPKRTYCNISKKHFNFLINFITVTLPAPQRHSDNEIKGVCFNNFLQCLREEFNLTDYVWRAEAQFNGNIHFHLVTNRYIHYTDLRRIWNNSIELLGYVSDFEAKWHHRNPPTEEVRAVKHIRRISNYLAKYMSKTRSFQKIGELRVIKGEVKEVLFGSVEYRAEKGGKKAGRIIGSVISGPLRCIEGRLWFLSRSLSKCKPIQIAQDEYSFSDVEELLSKTSVKCYQSDFVCSYYGKFSTTAKRIKSPLVDKFNESWL